MKQERLYYLGNLNRERQKIVFCKDGEWRLYTECEEDWSQVLVLPSSEAYRLRDELEFKSKIWNPKDIHPYNNSFNRQIYAFMNFDESKNKWVVIGKCLADGYSEACDKFGVDYKEAQGADIGRVSFYDQLDRYEDGVYEGGVLQAVDEMKITHR